MQFVYKTHTEYIAIQIIVCKMDLNFSIFCTSCCALPRFRLANHGTYRYQISELMVIYCIKLPIIKLNKPKSLCVGIWKRMTNDKFVQLASQLANLWTYVAQMPRLSDWMKSLANHFPQIRHQPKSHLINYFDLIHYIKK